MSPASRQLAPHSPARRALAFAGLLYLLTLLSAPIFLPAQDAKLPACCRRAGAHHCAMNSMALASDSASASAPDSASNSPAPAITAVSHCPSWPRAFATPHSQAFAPQPSAGISAALLSAATLRTRNDALARIARLRQLSLRGPPPARLA
jgi:hypothetical protein